MARHNVSGIYIFDTLPGDDGREPTCVEDCTESTRMAWLGTLNQEQREDCAKRLAVVLREVVQVAERDGCIAALTAKMLRREAARWEADAPLVARLDDYCVTLREAVETFGIFANFNDDGRTEV